MHLLTLLGVNAVPAVGWFVGDWSAGTTLVVYWFQNVAGSLSIAVLIAAHRRLSPRRGHFRYQPPDQRRSQRSSFIAGFLVTSMAFCAAHGIFLGVILFLLNHNGDRGLAVVDWRRVATGCLIVLVFLVADLAVDLTRVRRWSFLQVEQTAHRSIGRIVVVHLTLVLGMFGAVMTDASALFGVFVVLKTLHALSTALPQWEPATPPAWLSRAMNRLPNVHPGKRFEEVWAKDRADEAERRERNEEPWTARR
ncbi:MAG TPA: DUF6498-containing protein [Mycobacterium sp.]|nr:DUF6498-containing protein [Mycobacterium sp.]